jgi:hypothetical protein
LILTPSMLQCLALIIQDKRLYKSDRCWVTSQHEHAVGRLGVSNSSLEHCDEFVYSSIAPCCVSYAVDHHGQADRVNLAI